MKPYQLTKLLVHALLALLISSCKKTVKTNDGKNQKQSEIIALLKQSKRKSDDVGLRLIAIDKAFSLIADTKNDSLLLAIFEQKSNLYYSMGNRDSSLYYDRKLLGKAQKLGSNLFQATAAFNLAYYHASNKVLDSAFYYHKLSKENYALQGDTIKIGRRLLSMANIQNSISDFYGSKETVTEAIKHLESTHDQRYLAACYSLLASNHRKLLNTTDAMKYYKKAIDIADTNFKLGYKNNLANVYIEQGKYKEAIDLLTFKKEDKIKLGIIDELDRINDNLAYAKWLYKGENVEKELLTALNNRINSKDWYGAISSYTHLGEYYSKSNPNSALKHFDTVIQLSRKIGVPKAETDALKFLMVLEPNNLTIRERYIFLKDSMYTNELKVKTQFAKMKYDDEREKIKIQMLEAESVEKRVALAEQKTQKVIFLALSGVLLIGGIAYYYVLQQRHKKEKITEVYRTENRISKRVHDELANDIYGVMVSIQQKQIDSKSNSILNKLENIYKRTRTISQDTGKINVGKNFKEELRDMLLPFHGSGTAVIIRGLQEIDWEKLEDHKCIAIYRVLKELMVNMRKHAHANLVGLTFKHHKKKLQINYSDNGIGFKPQQKTGNGLQNTVSRIRNVGGEFKFESDKGNGVKISLNIPF